MFEVRKNVHDSMYHKSEIDWVIINRKTGEVIGYYQQLGVANMTAALMNRMNI